jgi:hypothetical protein
VPFYIDVKFECLTAELGYSVGDVLRHTSAGTGLGAIQADATNLILITQSAIAINRKDTHIPATVTAANWKITLTPYAII